ncbi:MAG: hypothetical protein ABI288_07820 [Ginsengibacter sp.]
MKLKTKSWLTGIIALAVLRLTPALAQDRIETGNLLSNPAFDFHSFINHRLGEPVSFSSHNVAFWNTNEWGDIEVMREPHVSETVRPKFSTHNIISISPGKKLWQFFTLPEAGLAHGELINLSVYGYQKKGNQIKAVIKLMKLDSEDGEWSPKDFGMRDPRNFPRHSRGELVIAKEYSIDDQTPGTILLKIKNAIIEGRKGEGNQSHTNDMNTIGIQVEFENTDKSDTAWIYAPKLTAENSDLKPATLSSRETPYYRYIPRTIQKLWKGEPIHVIVMGSSIDRGSANPPMYFYNEDPDSKNFKQPIAEGLFDAVKAGRPDLDGYFGEWRHFYSYAGRLKLELMRKFNLTADKICLNFMASDGSSVGEAHSGLKEYCSLSIPPDPGLNGHKKGKSWQKLYPELFTRPEGPRPDLIIFGSGANERTDTPDEVAVFEGAIRWIQQHYPNTEFLFCQFQNFGGYTPNTGDLQALSLRYQIPMLDYGKNSDDVTRWCNRYALVPADGHPQAAAHYLWFKQLERAFETWDPIVTGQAQLQLPERLHPNSYGWEGEIVTFDSSSSRIKNNRFIFEDNVINCWGRVAIEPPVPYVDGVKLESRRSSPVHDIRNSMFRYGHTSLGERHILEIKGENASLTYVDAKKNANRLFYPIDNPNWKITGNKIRDYKSEWGAPYGSRRITLQPGKWIELEAMCTDLSVAYIDQPDGGSLEIVVDSHHKLSQPANVGFVDTDKKVNFLENRKGILNLGYGLHKVRLTAKDNPVDVLGVFTYDSRANLNAERRLAGIASGGDIVEFTLPFKARPLVICTAGLTVKNEDISSTQVKFSGTSGSYQVIGE